MIKKLLLTVGLLSATACSADAFSSPLTDAGTDSLETDSQPGDVADGGTKADVFEASADSPWTAVGPLNGCTEQSSVDMTAAGGTINWGSPVTPKCVKILKNQSVTWKGDFSIDPLGSFGGSNGTPIILTTTGTSVTFQFTKVGIFGFHCLNHPSELGTVWVID